MKNILAADIGGTNSRFAHFISDPNDKLSLVETGWLKTAGSHSFAQLIEQLKNLDFTFNINDADVAIISVAGPVEDDVYCSPPFISWDISLSEIQNVFNAGQCILVNDFVAQAFACRSPVANSATQILPGIKRPNSPIAVVGAGTSLGKALLVPCGANDYVVVPSEGAHASFPFDSEKELEFQRFLLKKFGKAYITASQVVSGKGISYIHQFLTNEKLKPEEIAAKCSHDSETLAWAAKFYGRVCRNYALDTVALGGMYIVGGVAAKMPGLIKHEAFNEEFQNSRFMSGLLRGIPVFLIDNEESGLWGAAALCNQKLKKSNGRSFRTVYR